MTDFFRISKLSKEEFEKLYRFTKLSFDEVKFCAYKVGCCNATMSIEFANAECDLHCVKQNNEPVYFNFGWLYKKGFDLMKKVFSGTDKYEDFDEPSKTALQTLVTFLKNIETHEKSLVKVLQETTDLKITDVVTVLTEHLLGKLGPGESVFIDSSSKRRCMCRCGCNADIKVGGTGIGNEHVWHGFLDVIFESHGEIVNGASTAKARLHLEDEDNSEENEDSSDVKGFFTDAMENQAAAQAIVLSILQRNKHPQLDNYLIPFTAISASHIKIFMYDAENDILLRCREEMPIFMETERRHLSLTTVITLWMILHYNNFCSGIDLGKLSINLEDLKSGFAERIAACSEYYDALKSRVSSFPIVEKEKFNIGPYMGTDGYIEIDDPFPPCAFPV